MKKNRKKWEKPRVGEIKIKHAEVYTRCLKFFPDWQFELGVCPGGCGTEFETLQS